MDVNRVSEMETILNDCSAAADRLEAGIEGMEQIGERMKKLFSYYGSEDWYGSPYIKTPGTGGKAIWLFRPSRGLLSQRRRDAKHLKQLFLVGVRPGKDELVNLFCDSTSRLQRLLTYLRSILISPARDGRRRISACSSSPPSCCARECRGSREGARGI
ncbi:MAG: DUF4298 domain-containing protein [Clostridia bacterium]|nr:DUF4298 domain-containing protein [Clostridia bacterium]